MPAGESTYEEACKCGKGPPEGPDETLEESRRRRFGSNYRETGIGLIQSEVRIGNRQQAFENNVARNAKNEGPKGKSGDGGKPGETGSKPGPGKTEQKACMCGAFGSRGGSGSNGRRL